MPGIVDDLIASELARMVGDDLVVEEDYDALGIDLFTPGKAFSGDLIEAGAHAVELEISWRSIRQPPRVRAKMLKGCFGSLASEPPAGR